MTTTEQSEVYCPDVAAIAAQNDSFRRYHCLGATPEIPLLGTAVVTHALDGRGPDFVELRQHRLAHSRASMKRMNRKVVTTSAPSMS